MSGSLLIIGWAILSPVVYQRPVLVSFMCKCWFRWTISRCDFADIPVPCLGVIGTITIGGTHLHQVCLAAGTVIPYMS